MTKIVILNNLQMYVNEVANSSSVPDASIVAPRYGNSFIFLLEPPSLAVDIFKERVGKGKFLVREMDSSFRDFIYTKDGRGIDFTDTVSLSSFLSAQLKSINIPGKNVNTIEIPTPYGSFTIGGKQNSSQITATFVDISGALIQEFFESWMSLVVDADITGTMGIPSLYKGNIVVSEVLWEEKENGADVYPSRALLFEGAFPISVSDTSLDSSGSIVNVDVSFAYDRRIPVQTYSEKTREYIFASLRKVIEGI